MKERKIKIRKGISKEIEVSILGCTCGALIAAGVIVPIAVSTYNSNRNRYFKCDVNELGEYVVSGTMKFDYLKNYYFVEISNNSFESKEFYICEKKEFRYETEYTNILNNKVIYSKSDSDSQNEDSKRSITSEILIEDYLYAFDMIKEEYTPDDVKNILEQIKSSTLEKENKVLVKSTFNKYFTKI